MTLPANERYGVIRHGTLAGATTMTRMRRLVKPSHSSGRACPCHVFPPCSPPSVIRQQSHRREHFCDSEYRLSSAQWMVKPERNLWYGDHPYLETNILICISKARAWYTGNACL